MGEYFPSGGSLEGHLLLIITPTPPPSEYVERLEVNHPGLKVVHQPQDPWKDLSVAEDVDWKKVTILLTGRVLPTIKQAPRLQYVQLQSAGANMILDLPIFKDTDIVFCSASGVHGPQISEWVICTFLAAQHHIPRYLEQQKDGLWKRDNFEQVQDSVGLRVGILGYGSIGRQVARVAKAMGMDVVAYTNRPRPTPESRQDHSYVVPGMGDPEGLLPSKWYSGTDQASRTEFLTSGLDLLVLAVPLTKYTKDLISGPQLKLLSEKKTFISNIGRGPVLNTDALIEALENGWIRGAALDVTDPEPLPQDHPLWHTKNVIITPHVSGSSISYTQRVLAILELNVNKLSEGKDLLNEVDKKLGY
ncbi:D-isomer specific 2-hydroxyacid dehydrogenase [Pseudomassariella vexata]|uniref:D-isomer specific 2-hydroxyacid dehydrogenase n=1 Tax=Pseudomassariella vexata TaxID=1141098 RepID=A0A1Y2EAG9_9PEZI|nr:D-isomer specific 2-hydroxyacid dehydrogenase [Pseudomassariella vexata]ORY68563.1 D-isomer specific 2-hydroxyacid dehydrogenase [Pseudomassariella vexata]